MSSESNWISLSKYFLVFFNFLIFLGGVALVSVGVWALVDTTAIKDISEFMGVDFYKSSSCIITFCGVVVMVISFLGCCGSIRENKLMLSLFFACVLLIFIILMAGGIMAYLFRDHLTSTLKGHMRTSLRTMYGTQKEDRQPHKLTAEAVTDAWNSLQTLFQCCGVHGRENGTTSWMEYRRSYWFNITNSGVRKAFVPASCCTRDDDGSYLDLDRCQGRSPLGGVAPFQAGGKKRNPYLYGQGCYDEVQKFVAHNSRLLGGIAITVLMVMVVAMVTSVTMCKRIKGPETVHAMPT